MNGEYSNFGGSPADSAACDGGLVWYSPKTEKDRRPKSKPLAVNRFTVLLLDLFRFARRRHGG